MFNVNSLRDAGNYRTVSDVNALDKVADKIRESRICGHLSKISLERTFRSRVILKKLKNIEKTPVLIDEVHWNSKNFFFSDLKRCSGDSALVG